MYFTMHLSVPKIQLTVSHCTFELLYQELLLSEAEVQLMEMERAWSIDFDDVHLERRIDAESPGSFGEVSCRILFCEELGAFLTVQFVCMCVYKCVCVYVCVYVYVFMLMCMYMYICMDVCVSMHVCVCVCLCLCLCYRIYIYIYIYMHMYVHTYICMH